MNRSVIGSQFEFQPFVREWNFDAGFKAGGHNYLLKFIVEKTITVNTTAVGCNVELLS